MSHGIHCEYLTQQPEYIQLCKTLYTLLQDSYEEQGLLPAMGRVANRLLEEGESNIQEGSTPVSNSVGDSTTSGDTTTTAERPEGVRGTEHTRCASETNSTHSDKLVEIISKGDKPLTPELEQESEQHKSNVSGLGEGGGYSRETTPGQSGDSSSEFEVALADAERREASWYLSFEQFVAGIQQEPDLCQFFAEQNTIDLSGTNVDPVLNPYTRFILATK